MPDMMATIMNNIRYNTIKSGNSIMIIQSVRVALE